MANSTPPPVSSSTSSSAEELQHRNKCWPAQRNGKVAIPRRRQHGESIASVLAPPQQSVTGAKSTRISHACESCRLRKTKCSGERPVCSHCRAFSIDCYYAHNKRDRTREELQDLRDKVQKYEETFRKIGPALDQSVKDLVSQVFPLQSPPETTETIPGEGDWRDGLPPTNDDERESLGEDLVSAEVGSIGSVDHLNEDINSIGISSPEGYVGKPSDIDWIKKIFEVANEAENDDMDNIEKGFWNPRISEIETVSYNLDDLDISVESVDLCSMPPKDIADKLIDCYFETVHPSFPFLFEPLFRYQYDSFCAEYLNDVDPQWLALLNLVLAISSVYAHNIKAEFGRHDLDHLQYYIRSKLLKPDVTAPGDIQHVQYIALLSFYLFASNLLNRSYSMLGLAIRHGQGIGLHLLVNGAGMTDVQKEVRVRLWNAMYVFERMISSMTGRPSMISDQLTTAPLPSTNAETDNWESIPQIIQRPLTKTTILSGQYFVYETLLSKILGQAMDRLYAPGVTKVSWSAAQQIVEELNQALDNWRDSLSDVFSIDFHNIDLATAGDDLTLLRMRTILAIQYYDVTRMVNRPCLCLGEIPNESPRSKEFSQNCAIRCMQAGHRSLSLFPDLIPSPRLPQFTRDLITVLPWWSVAHYMMSSISAIVLGHVMDYKPNWPNEADMRNDLEKCLAWFQSFEEDSLTSKRCADIIRGFKDCVLHKVSPLLSPTTLLQPITSDQSMQSHIQQQGKEHRSQQSSTPLLPISQPQQPATTSSAYYYTGTAGQSPFSMQSYSAYYMQDVDSSSSNIMNTASVPMDTPAQHSTEGMLGTKTPHTPHARQTAHSMTHQMAPQPLQEPSPTPPYYTAMSTQQDIQEFEPHALQSIEHSFNPPSYAIRQQNTSRSDHYAPQHTAECIIGHFPPQNEQQDGK
ncbi:fungal-specific transcription factor domain-containing protein [Lipomyces chichibuensis]|uniref:fungal-specific transcription factor domain-containing protein n=1 Tax=Lipomyces chichibuensis TaxID=1546026 RepID=UPI003343A8F6